MTNNLAEGADLRDVASEVAGRIRYVASRLRMMDQEPVQDWELIILEEILEDAATGLSPKRKRSRRSRLRMLAGGAR